MGRKAQVTREKLIEAALTVLRERGGNQVTLDAVAAQAEVSKGGLLHHFANKEALIAGIIRHLYGLFNARVERYYAEDIDPVGRWSRAYIRASFDEFEVPLQALVGLFPYVDESDPLREIPQEDLRMWSARLTDDGIPPARATVIRLACDSVWTERALKMDDQAVSPDDLRAELLRLTR